MVSVPPLGIVQTMGCADLVVGSRDLGGARGDVFAEPSTLVKGNGSITCDDPFVAKGRRL